MNKKFFSFALVLTLAAALGACGEGADTPDATTTTPAGGTSSPAATTPATSPSPAATTSPAKPPAKTP
ncbi:hypothetical protein [Microcoleus sp. FACHB-672]|uniref:hypothetical protein n=1 Tax=Microcoleus sp. FACHB-672 TaxID=2692825 RepID=UPI00168567F3|nr:hypothetical protein [Microcoleus sp. FACHB-672]MBD2040782.1 hypothetical protein [Microcoleus sp. FACHB-672]